MFTFHDKREGSFSLLCLRHLGAALKDSPSILEGVPEGQGSNMGDWPLGHPCGIEDSWGSLSY